MEALKKMLKDLFTENDNESADLMPIVALLANLVFLGMSIYIYGIAKTQPWDPMVFGAGFAAIQTAWGISYKLKLDAQTKAETTLPSTVTK